MFKLIIKCVILLFLMDNISYASNTQERKKISVIEVGQFLNQDNKYKVQKNKMTNQDQNKTKKLKKKQEIKVKKPVITKDMETDFKDKPSEKFDPFSLKNEKIDKKDTLLNIF